MPAPRRSPLPRPVPLVLAVGVIVALVYFGLTRQQEHSPPAAGTHGEVVEKAPAKQTGVVIKNVTLRDRDGDVVFRGNIDLTPTIARIKSGRKLTEFRNDGSVFQNRERRLPRQPAGYYREWVHPTPKLLPSPGPQRIVTGEKGEFYYTPDHYESFQRLKLQPGDKP